MTCAPEVRTVTYGPDQNTDALDRWMGFDQAMAEPAELVNRAALEAWLDDSNESLPRLAIVLLLLGAEYAEARSRAVGDLVR
ncbi:hypothetical protein LCGC14_1373910 [marine sediment metagenome]|uniref:Uncharacterized protein n=2 Tax=marine sediment metagenome TaxID=412755 RepID=A0A0F9KQL9_9ZZZZ